jgi:hypothetical protein
MQKSPPVPVLSQVEGLLVGLPMVRSKPVLRMKPEESKLSGQECPDYP